MTDQSQDSIFEIERMLLAAMMLRPGDCWRIDVEPKHFAIEQHGDILGVIRSRSIDALPVDPSSVMDHFERIGHRETGQLALEIAGGTAFITSIPEPYARRVMDAWRVRQAKDIGTKLVRSNEPSTIDEVISTLMDLYAIERNHEWDAKQATQAAFAHLSKLYEAGDVLPGITTGLDALDAKLGGFHDGDLVVVGGRAAMGKTAFLGGLATSAARGRHPVGIISGEQPVQQLAIRMLSAESQIDAMKFRNASFSERDWPAVMGSITTLSDLPMYFLDRSAPTMAEVVRVARRWKHKHGIKALYIDYLQRIVGEGERKFEQVGNVARGLKNLARDLNIPVIVLAQVNRAVEQRVDKAPRMGDLSDSSEIEKEADQILMLFRQGYYDDTVDPRLARVIVEKNRHGPTGYVDVHWNGGIMTFTDREVAGMF